MFTLEEYRERYAHSNTEDLIALLAIDPHQLTPEARTALSEEAETRGLSVMPGEASVVSKALRHRYAKVRFSDRLGAFFIDCLVGLGPALAAGLVGLIIDVGKPSKTTAAINALSLCTWALYYGFTKDGRGRGQSIGKKKFDLMVVKIETDTPCTTGASMMRAFTLCMLFMIPLVGWVIEPLAIAADEDGRRAGDAAAGTQVIRVSEYEAIQHQRD